MGEHSRLEQNVIIRVDSNPIIASGHLMRCLSIAEECKRNDIHVLFLVADNYCIETLKKKDFPYIVLDSKWDNLEDEIDKVRGIIGQYQNTILLIDTYYVTKHYIDCMKTVTKVCYLGSKKEILGELDLIINYSADINEMFYQKGYKDNTRKLLGVAYAPLRNEFVNVQMHYNEDVKRVLLTTGNTNKNNIVSKILDHLIPLSYEYKFDIDVVVGSMFSDVNEWKSKYENDTSVVWHYNVSDMLALMKKADLAVTANGTTVYELAASYVPIVSFAMVEEQFNSGKALDELGVLEFCGEAYREEEICLDNISQMVREYCMDSEKRHNKSISAHKKIAGNGCQLIVGEIKSLLQ